MREVLSRILREPVLSETQLGEFQETIATISAVAEAEDALAPFAWIPIALKRLEGLRTQYEGQNQWNFVKHLLDRESPTRPRMKPKTARNDKRAYRI